MKPVSYIPQPPCLLDQLREVLHYKHYSLSTEKLAVADTACPLDALALGH